jgi:putative ABC transport system ATP-binding protein
LDSRSTDNLLKIFQEINEEGQTILMVTHSIKAASHAKRVLFLRDGQIFHQIYLGDMSQDEMYAKISDTLTLLMTKNEQEIDAEEARRAATTGRLEE